MAAQDHIHPDQFHHVTTAAALPSIREHGLNNELSRDELWSNTDDWDSGAYLWDSRERAESYAADLSEMGHEPHILTVRGKGLEVSPDTSGVTPVEGGWHAQHVPPEHIE